MESKHFYDRGNFFLAAQAIFANAFATLAISSNLVGLYKFLPIIICLIGISLNITWFYSSYVQKVQLVRLQVNLKDVVYKILPAILGIGWGVFLILFTLQAFGIIKITL